ncbi:MAG TPA: PAS domain S-box protein [Bacteroidia bacterium]|nr:PAS domain S-box protein [Bacteroidia bacterium]
MERINNRLKEAKLKQENYESIIDKANDAMFVIDIVDGKILQANPSAALMIGLSEELLLQKKIIEIIPPEYAEKSAEAISDTWEKGGLIYKHIPFLAADGTLVPVECSAKVATFSGHPAIVIYARDIRERLRLEHEVEMQKNIIEEKNKDILASLRYAMGIQDAIFMDINGLQKIIPDSFILYKPKDIVSGDFFWYKSLRTSLSEESKKKLGIIEDANLVVLAAVDCTGHGVPGAFMSIMSNILLNQTVKNPEINSPAELLNYLQIELFRTFNQNSDRPVRQDGMDMAFCAIDFTKMEVVFAGANNPLLIIRNRELIEIKANKQAITAAVEYPEKPFENHVFKLQKNDCLYIFTDGFNDQFGGAKGKKFKYSRFKELVLSLDKESMAAQKNIFEKTFDDWKGDVEQVDDMLVIGVRI